MPDNWLHDDTSINVNVQSVADFATKVSDLAANFGKSWGEGIIPLMQAPVSFSGGGLQEGQLFQSLHQRNQAAATRLLADVGRCLGALTMAATAVATEYMFGDAESASTVDDVRNAFTPHAPPSPATGTTTVPTEGTDDEPTLPPGVDVDPDSSPTADDRHGGSVIAEGQPGEYEIAADNERIYDDTGDDRDVDPIPRPEY